MRFEAPVENQTWVLMGALDIYRVNKTVEFRTTCVIPALLFLQLASRLPVYTGVEVGTKPAVQPVSLQIGTITVNIALQNSEEMALLIISRANYRATLLTALFLSACLRWYTSRSFTHFCGFIILEAFFFSLS